MFTWNHHEWIKSLAITIKALQLKVEEQDPFPFFIFTNHLFVESRKTTVLSYYKLWRLCLYMTSISVNSILFNKKSFSIFCHTANWILSTRWRFD
ncbi:hypothetical protein BpHYR1_015435 [Brachionus plicatilis]|uniref:Uncharacterized protein n=1 Tax=Brachionus plicatilis TaxID=10195 RepID=A0A3M7QAZ4_BRAPC|nr:hypothetical protein BpHYR1_015435 [Brachionus plicatilis]